MQEHKCNIRNEKCPFIVHTHAMDIEVLGTKFNVEAYAKQQNFEASEYRAAETNTITVQKAA